MNREMMLSVFGKNTKRMVLCKNLSNEDLDCLSGKRLNVLFFICQCLDKKGNYVSDFCNGVIATKCNVNLKTVSIYIRSLVDGGFLIKSTQYNHYYFLNQTKVIAK